jgi:hypothetical protein
VNVKLFYSGGPYDGLVHEIESNPVADTPDILWADYTVTPYPSIRPDEKLDTSMSRGTYRFDHRDAANNVYYTWVTT